MQIATSKTREQFPLNRRKIIKKALTRTIVWAVLLAIISATLTPLFMAASQSSNVFTFISAKIIIIFFLILLLVFIAEYFFQRWYFAVYFYDLTDDFITIKKGPITPKEINVPYERIQDVYVDQDLFDRIFGIYDVHISSATFMSGAEAHIDGVEKESAQELRNLILEIINKKIHK